MLKFYETMGDYFCMEGDLEKAVKFWDKAIAAKERGMIKWHERARWNFWTGVKDWAERHGVRWLTCVAYRRRG